MSTPNWTEIVVTDAEGGTVGTLGEMVERQDEALARAVVDTERGGIREWEQYYMAAPGEEPDWDTPRGAVDWTDFPGCLYCGRVVPEMLDPRQMDESDWTAEAAHHARDCEWIATRAHDGDVIQIGTHRFALQGWDAEDQKCDHEVVFAGYTRAEWEHETDAEAIVVYSAKGNTWSWTTADYNPSLHDEGGLRVVGHWHTGAAKLAGKASDLWG